jgi:hypothetical protein
MAHQTVSDWRLWRGGVLRVIAGRQHTGYRFATADRSIVISGDAAPSQTVIDQCNGCDVLIHEAYSLMTYNDVTRPHQEYREKHHTSSRELAELATKARPGLLILYHRANPGGVGRPNAEGVHSTNCAPTTPAKSSPDMTSMSTRSSGATRPAA